MAPSRRAKAGEEWDVLATGDDVDAVDLDDSHAVDDPLDVTHGGRARRWSGVVETLGGDGDAPCLGLGQPGSLEGHGSTLRAGAGRLPILWLAAVVRRPLPMQNVEIRKTL